MNENGKGVSPYLQVDEMGVSICRKQTSHDFEKLEVPRPSFSHSDFRGRTDNVKGIELNETKQK